MADYDITKLAAIGLNADQSPFTLAPEGWTGLRNMCYRDGKLMRLPGWYQIFGALPIAPHFTFPVVDQDFVTWWIYTSLTKAYVYDMTAGTHHNITRQSGGVDVDYVTAATRQWQGFSFRGIPILNNTNEPQYWAAYDPAQRLQNIPNWDATWRAGYLTALGPHMFALNIRKGSTQYRHMVKWSHPADPGALPASWDETDPTKDAGEYELPSEDAGPIHMGLPLNNALFIYKQGTIWRTHFVGGRAVFAFNQFVATGVPSSRAVCITPDGSGHAMISHDDLLYHDGQTVRSLLTGRYRSVMRKMPLDYALDWFCFAHPVRKEVWFCMKPDSVVPYEAVIWNMEHDALSHATLDFKNAAVGQHTPSATHAPAKTVVICDPDNSRLGVMDAQIRYLSNVTWQRWGAPYDSFAQRVGLALVGRNRQGEPIVDLKQYKLFTRMWITADRLGDYTSDPAPLSVRIGYQEFADDTEAGTPPEAVTWTAAQTFDPTTQNYLDFEVSGRALAVEFSSSSDGAGFELHGYKIELELLGNF